LRRVKTTFLKVKGLLTPGNNFGPLDPKMGKFGPMAPQNWWKDPEIIFKFRRPTRGPKPNSPLNKWEVVKTPNGKRRSF